MRSKHARKVHPSIDSSKFRFKTDSKARYRVVSDGLTYSVVDTMPGLVVSRCRNEQSACKRAHELNRRVDPSAMVATARRMAAKAAHRAEEQKLREQRRSTVFVRKQVKRRFWTTVEQTDWCWFWRGPRAAHGYPQFSANGVHILAHRYAYIITNGDIPAGIEIVRKCGERLCVNPNHMLAMTTEQRQAMYRREKFVQTLCQTGNSSLGYPQRPQR